jgi:hypothetical protein
MRRVVVPVVALAILVIPGTASALCTTEPFDQAVGQSDAVLVGTIVSARSLSHRIGPDRWGGHGGVLVRIDVEDVLKGSANAGDAFILGSCAPPLGGPGAQSDARKVIGDHGLFLITIPTHGYASSQPNGAMTPQGSVDERTARARQLLGLDRPWTDTLLSSPTQVALIVGGLLAAAILLVFGLLVARSRRRGAG